MDFYTNLSFKVQKGRGLGSRDDGPILRPDDKTTPKWAWPGSRDQISKFWDPLITFE